MNVQSAAVRRGVRGWATRGGWALGWALLAWSGTTGLAQAPATAESLVVDGAASLRQWVPPAYPADALKEGVGGAVLVRLVVDATGAVTSARVLGSPDPRLDAPALAAVRSWSFSPALDRGQPAACGLDAPVRFDPVEAKKRRKTPLLPEERDFPQLSPRTEAVARETPAGPYPELLIRRKLSGFVRFVGRVSPEGRLLDPRITAATHPDFAIPALDSLAKWTFTPAQQGDLAVASEVRGEVTYDTMANDRGEVLAANGLTGPDGARPAFTPELIVLVEPVRPFDLLLKGEAGAVTAELVVGETGFVRDVVIQAATHPECEHAVRAALRGWVFGRTVDGGRTRAVSLRLQVAFPAVAPDAVATPESDPETRLAVAWRAGRIGTAKGLDGKLQPLHRVAPEYPPELRENGSPSGTVEVEFVIDREGRARLPHAVKATHEAMGWAAVTAVSQWVFAPPQRGGQAVDIRVRIPFDFKPE